MGERRDRLRAWVRRTKSDTYALYLASRNPATPWYAKLIALLTAAYALSPIDLIPDFVPVLGYLDDLVLVPLGIFIAVRLIPDEVMEESRRRAAELELDETASKAGLVIVVLIWVFVAALLGAWLVALVKR